MAEPVDFYFDFSSPYGYLASAQIESIAAEHGRTVDWHPILLGFVFKVTDGKPLVQIPLKGEYSVHDMKRCAREKNIPFNLPEKFPIGTVAAARAVLWAGINRSGKAAREKQGELVHSLYKAYFADGIDISDPATVIDIAVTTGFKEAEISTALEDPDVKALLRSSVDVAVAKGVFGSPFMIADGEPFWGHDRLDHLSRWMATGGW